MRTVFGRRGGFVVDQLKVPPVEASTLVGRLQLWTADSPLATVATELGIGYE
jgi:hypothetical protein